MSPKLPIRDPDLSDLSYVSDLFILPLACHPDSELVEMVLSPTPAKRTQNDLSLPSCHSREGGNPEVLSH